MGSYMSLALCCLLYPWLLGSLGLPVCLFISHMNSMAHTLIAMWNENQQDEITIVMILVVRLKETIQVNTF